jgi:hypothetical protein
VTREHPETLEMRDDYECPDDADESPVVKLAVYGQCICCHEISRGKIQ